MTLASAFSTAWKDLKATAAKVAKAVNRNSAIIQTVVTDASAVAVAVDPSAAGLVTAFDALEELIVGKIAAAASDVANAASFEALFAEVWPAVKALISTLEHHPTVATVTAALGGAPATASKELKA
jgi:hypothetical protein